MLTLKIKLNYSEYTFVNKMMINRWRAFGVCRGYWETRAQLAKSFIGPTTIDGLRIKLKIH